MKQNFPTNQTKLTYHFLTPLETCFSIQKKQGFWTQTRFVVINLDCWHCLTVCSSHFSSVLINGRVGLLTSAYWAGICVGRHSRSDTSGRLWHASIPSVFTAALINLDCWRLWHIDLCSFDIQGDKFELLHNVCGVLIGAAFLTKCSETVARLSSGWLHPSLRTRL